MCKAPGADAISSEVYKHEVLEERGCPARFQRCLHYTPWQEEKKSLGMWQPQGHLTTLHSREGPCQDSSQLPHWAPWTQPAAREPVCDFGKERMTIMKGCVE